MSYLRDVARVYCIWRIAPCPALRRRPLRGARDSFPERPTDIPDLPETVNVKGLQPVESMPLLVAVAVTLRVSRAA
jgi:hypothetical protein